jgi:hypothetical protein
MTAATFVEGNTVHLPDVNGFHATIPARHLHVVAHTANQADTERAQYGLRWFGRDALNGARDLLDSRDQCTFTTPAGDCDQAAVFDLANARDRCADHKQENR